MKKWCIKVTSENLPIVGKWFNENSQNWFQFIHREYLGMYFHYPMSDNEEHSASSIQDGYTELTLEQFKEQILKEQILKEPNVLQEILDKILDKQYQYIDILRKEVVLVEDIKNVFLEYGIKIEPKF